MGGLLLRLFLVLPLVLLTECMVVEEEEEDREVDLSRVGMMRTMTKKGPWLGRTGAPTAGAPCHTQHCSLKSYGG